MQARHTVCEDIARRLLDWHDCHGRHDLPWQHPRTPYRVWVSEIMLQQTQVATVIGYYQRFMNRFPDLQSLADAPLDDVLKHWEGLGYYARARNLHRCARQIARNGGDFPKTVESLEALPGIGRSTAGAILSLSQDIRAPILDGNVKRVLCRHEGITEVPVATGALKRLWLIAEHYTPEDRFADYTQAIMDLGASLCSRTRPDCERCPLTATCQAKALGIQESLPARPVKKQKPIRKRTAWLLQRPDGFIFLERRPESGIWGGLWSLPETDQECRERAIADATETRLIPANETVKITEAQALERIEHTFSHYHLHLQPHRIPVDDQFTPKECSGDWFPPQGPFPGLPAPIQKWLKRMS